MLNGVQLAQLLEQLFGTDEGIFHQLPEATAKLFIGLGFQQGNIHRKLNVRKIEGSDTVL